MLKVAAARGGYGGLPRLYHKLRVQARLVADVSATPAVDGLVDVTNHEEVAVIAT